MFYPVQSLVRNGVLVVPNTSCSILGTEGHLAFYRNNELALSERRQTLHHGNLLGRDKNGLSASSALKRQVSVFSVYPGPLGKSLLPKESQVNRKRKDLYHHSGTK